MRSEREPRLVRNTVRPLTDRIMERLAAGEEGNRQADVDRLPVGNRRQEGGIVANERNKLERELVDRFGTVAVGHRLRNLGEVVRDPHEPQTPERDAPDHLEQLQIYVDRAHRADRRGYAVLGIGMW